jgi:phosphatidylglycerol---prolipoprotein diacylglyceryl transferase
MLLVITDPISPAIHLGPLSIRWYGVGYAVAFLAGGWLAIYHLAGRGTPRHLTERVTFWTIIAGLVGARLYFVAQNRPLWYLTHPQHLVAVWEGGMAFFGAVFCALVALLFWSWRLRLDFWDVLDAGVLFAAVGQPIGRIGNIMNGEILGPPSSLPWAIRYTNPESMAPHLGVAYQPANAYEGLATLCILAVLLLLRRRGVASGLLGLTYLVLYPISQLVVFYWRTDAETPVVLLGLKQAQLTALFVLIVVVPVFVLAWRRAHRPSGRAPSAAAMGGTSR